MRLVVNWDFDPVMLHLGTLDIRYYGLMWALALLAGMLFFDNFCRREGLDQKVSSSAFLYGTLATILGARLGHCLFYEPGYFLTHPWEIITGFRDGGLASHGAALGLLVGLWLFARKNKLPYIWPLDRVMIPVAIGGAAVRLGNLFNSEIVGDFTTVPWGFRFLRNFPAGADVPAQHPTQLYEAVCYVLIFAVLTWLYYGRDAGRKHPGALFGVGLVGIFAARFFIEFVKVEQEAFERGWALDMGQWLSIPFVVLGFWILWRAYKRPFAVTMPGRKAAAKGSTHKK